MSCLELMWFVPAPLLALATQAPGATALHARRTTSSDAQFAALAAGQVDAVVTAMDNVIGWNRRAGPQDFRVVAQVETTTPLFLFAAPGRARMAQLRGATVLVDAAENGFAIALRALLHAAGLEDGACHLREAGGVLERYQALLAGQGDATLLGEPFASQARAAGLVQIASVQETWPAFPGQGLVMRQDSPARERIGAWLRELEQARLQLHDLPSLRPAREGVALLTGQRRLLGLPGGEDAYTDIVDTTLLDIFLGRVS